MSTITTSVKPFTRAVTRGRVASATLAVAAVAACALPAAPAPAEAAGPPSLPALGSLSVLSNAGQAVNLLQGLTLPQLAGLLDTTPAELVNEISSQAGGGTVTNLLDSLLGNPTATLEDLIGELGSDGIGAGVVENVVNSLLSPAISSSGQLQGVVQTVLSDLDADGNLAPLAQQLNVPVSELERVGVLPVTTESLASTLDTTVEQVGEALKGAGAITAPLQLTTPLAEIPVLSNNGEGTTDVVAVPAPGGGVSLTTLYSPASTSDTTTAGSTAAAGSPAAISNAFSIVSIKINKNGTIAETVKVPSAGHVSVASSARGTVASAGHSRKRSFKVSPASANIVAGTHTITLHPAGAIKKAKNIQVTVNTTYTPSGGKALTKRSKVTLRRASTKRR